MLLKHSPRILVCLTAIVLGSTTWAAVDHSNFIFKYEGAKTCETCHAGTIAQIQQTVHYKFESQVPEGYLHDEEGNPSNVTVSGKLWKLCGFPTTVPQFNWLGKLKDDPATPHIENTGGCAKCHIGIGVKPYSAVGKSEPQANEANNVDCLICHSATYQRKFYVATQNGEPVLNSMGAPVVYIAPQKDGVFDFNVYLADAKAVGQPQSDYCNRCHAGAGGGKVDLDDQEYSFKRGTPYAPEWDVHAKAGLTCSSCHTAGSTPELRHRTKRPLNNDIYAYDTPPVQHDMCMDCHGEKPHAGNVTYNNHTQFIACTTCHARSNGGAIHKDFAVIVPPDPSDPYALYEAKVTMADDSFALEYRWFGGKVKGEIHPMGSRGNGKIHPYKSVTFNQPVDANGHPIPVKWGTAYVKGDMPLAAKEGRDLYAAMWTEAMGKKYGLPPVPGEFAGYKEGPCGSFSISHAITSEKALTCKQCHSYSSVLDYKALGFDAAAADRLQALLGDTPNTAVLEWNLFH